MNTPIPWHRLLGMVLTEHPRNAAWEIFAGGMDRSRYGLNHYQPRSQLGLLLHHHLTTAYRLEVPDMAYTVDDFMRDTCELIVHDLAMLTPQQRQSVLEHMDAEERLRGLDPAAIKAWLERADHECVPDRSGTGN
jgi:hypothetical protein